MNVCANCLRKATPTSRQVGCILQRQSWPKLVRCSEKRQRRPHTGEARRSQRPRARRLPLVGRIPLRAPRQRTHRGVRQRLRRLGQAIQTWASSGRTAGLASSIAADTGSTTSKNPIESVSFDHRSSERTDGAVAAPPPPKAPASPSYSPMRPTASVAPGYCRPTSWKTCCISGKDVELHFDSGSTSPLCDTG